MFEKKTWTDRVTEYPTRRSLTKEDGSTELVTVTRDEGSVSTEGDAFSAENMNDLEARIEAGLPKYDYAILAANAGTPINITLVNALNVQDFRLLSLSLGDNASHNGSCQGCITIPTSLFQRYVNGIVVRAALGNNQVVYAQCKYINNTTVFIGVSSTGYSAMLCGIK